MKMFKASMFFSRTVRSKTVILSVWCSKTGMPFTVKFFRESPREKFRPVGIERQSLSLAPGAGEASPLTEYDIDEFEGFEKIICPRCGFKSRSDYPALFSCGHCHRDRCGAGYYYGRSNFGQPERRFRCLCGLDTPTVPSKTIAVDQPVAKLAMSAEYRALRGASVPPQRSAKKPKRQVIAATSKKQLPSAARTKSNKQIRGKTRPALAPVKRKLLPGK